MTEDRRRLAIGYLLLQAALCTAWWSMLLVVPGTRRAFVPASWPEAVLWSYWLPDVALWIGGSALAAVALVRRWTRGTAWLGVVAGATTYSTLHATSIAVATGDAWLAAALMAPAAAISGWFAFGRHRPQSAAR